MRLLMIIQDIAQLYDIYGHHGAQTFLNVKVRIAFAQNSLETAQYLSKLVGVKSNQLFQGKRGDKLAPLISAQQILNLDKSKSLILIEASLPILAKKVTWFKEKQLKIRNFGAIDMKIKLTEKEAI